MKYPTLNETPTSRQMVDAFRGYNHNLRIGDGEFYDMENLTSTYYPVLSPRGKRGVYKKGIKPMAMVGKDALCYLEGSRFVMNEYDEVDLKLQSYATASMLSMGAYVVIITRDEQGEIEEGVWVNTTDLADHGYIDADFTSANGETVSFELAKVDGSTYPKDINRDTAPYKPDNGDLWIDTSSTPHTLKQYSSSTSMWVAIPTTYIRINATGIGKDFNKYDGVVISGVEADELKDLNASMVIWDKGDDFIVVTGILKNVLTQTEPISVKRQMPYMDYVIECGNRLWGCRYGVARNGEVVNEIYASKLEDFKNWTCYMGISTDSFSVPRGTDGMFTGAVNYFGQPIFFKENCMHKVAGTVPSNFTVTDLVCRGVEQGSDKSLAIVNETLFYKSRNGICAYDGSLPTEISSAFGDVSYKKAVGCAHGNKYYVSMRDHTEGVHLLVYDAIKGLWHKESGVGAKEFCSLKGELYYIPESGDKVLTILGSGTADKAPVEWMAETGVLGADSPDKKYISRLNVRMTLPIGSRISFYAQYDSVGEWVRLATVNGRTLTTFTLPIRPRRCDHFRLRIVGTGDAKIYSICKTIEEGSDR
jgi:hypothetical protein